MTSLLDKLDLDGIPGLTPEIVQQVLDRVLQSGSPNKSIERLLKTAGPVAESRGIAGALKNSRKYAEGTISVVDTEFDNHMYMRMLLTGSVDSHALGIFYQAYLNEGENLGTPWSSVIDTGREVVVSLATGQGVPHALRVAIAGASAEGLPSASPMLRHLYANADTVRAVTRQAIADFGRVRAVAHMNTDSRMARVASACGFSKIESRNGHTIRIFEDK